MAARIRRIRQDDEIRNAIKTSQLINRLQNNANGEIELTTVQQKSIEILLRKSLPDLSAVEISGDQDNPVAIAITWRNTLSKSHTLQETSSSGSTIEHNDSPLSSATAEPAKPQPA